MNHELQDFINRLNTLKEELKLKSFKKADIIEELALALEHEQRKIDRQLKEFEEENAN